MPIYLVQHGLCVSKEEDPKKPLSKEGSEQVKRIAALLKNKGIKVDGVKHSGKERAKETAEIFASLICPSGNVVSIKGLAPLDNVADFAQDLDTETNHMFVGHLPFMERLVSFLISGNQDRKILKFHNAGVVCIEKEESDWFIKWTIHPKFC